MISPVGYLIIPIALVLFVKGRRALLWATLIAVPFTTLGVINIGVTTIRGFQFFGALFILRCLVDSVWSRTIGFTRSRANGLAALFLLVCFASLSMAVLQTGAVEVQPASGGGWPEFYSNIVPLELSVYNFTQILFPVFGVALYHFLVREIRSTGDLQNAVNILVWGALGVASMSLASGLLYTIGQGSTYQSFLSLFAAGPFTGVGVPEGGSIGQFFRSHTIGGEPGFTAMTILTGMGLVIGSMMQSQEARASMVRLPRLKLSILVVALLLNGSTTGYFGGALLLAWTLVFPWFTGAGDIRLFRRSMLYAVGGIAIVGIAAMTVQVAEMSFYEWVTEYHIAKVQGESGSGQIRSEVTWYTLREVFLTSPILGVGYGSHLSLSLVTFLLSNVGLVGFGVFLAFLFVVFRNAIHVVRSVRGPLGVVAFAAVMTFLPFLATLFIAKATSGMNYGLTWTVIALAEASYQVYRRRLSHQAA